MQVGVGLAGAVAVLLPPGGAGQAAEGGRAVELRPLRGGQQQRRAARQLLRRGDRCARPPRSPRQPSPFVAREVVCARLCRRSLHSPTRWTCAATRVSGAKCKIRLGSERGECDALQRRPRDSWRETERALCNAADAADAVFRINYPPLEGFEEHVGSKTTFDMTNHHHAQLIADPHSDHPLVPKGSHTFRSSSVSAPVRRCAVNAALLLAALPCEHLR